MCAWGSINEEYELTISGKMFPISLISGRETGFEIIRIALLITGSTTTEKFSLFKSNSYKTH